MSGQPQILIGADPELFLRDVKTKQFVSAHNIYPGTKLQPHKVNERVSIQVDGVAAEFNIKPADNPTDFVKSNQAALSILGNWKGIDGMELVIEPKAVFERGYWDRLPDDPKELGCNPDWNAWTGQVNPKPDAQATTMRTASGHIHVGWTNDEDPFDPVHFGDCRIVAKQMDYYLGMFSLMWDDDNDRRSLYGKAGAFRPKPYGMEYRTMSNRWLQSPGLMNWVWSAAYKAMIDIFKGQVAEGKYANLAVNCINHGSRWWKDKSKDGMKLQSLQSFCELSRPPLPVTRPQQAEIAKKANYYQNMGMSAANAMNMAQVDFAAPPIS